MFIADLSVYGANDFLLVLFGRTDLGLWHHDYVDFNGGCFFADFAGGVFRLLARGGRYALYRIGLAGFRGDDTPAVRLCVVLSAGTGAVWRVDRPCHRSVYAVFDDGVALCPWALDDDSHLENGAFPVLTIADNRIK